MARATGDNAKHSGPRLHAEKMKTIEATTTNRMASRFDMTPRGSSRVAVRGLSASKFASTNRLKPIAALRAATIATTIHSARTAISALSPEAFLLIASRAPVSANGNANTE